MLRETREAGEFLTGLIFINPAVDDFIERLDLVETPLAALPVERIKPGRDAMAEAMKDFA